MDAGSAAVAGVRIAVPEGWTVAAAPEGVDLLAHGPASGGPAPSFSVTTGPPPTASGRRDWLTQRFTSMAALLTDLQLIDFDATATVGTDDVPAIRLTAAYRQGVFSFTSELWGCFWPQRAALVSMTSLSLHHPHLLGAVEDVLADATAIDR